MRIEKRISNMKKVEEINTGEIFKIIENGEEFYILTTTKDRDGITDKMLFNAVNLSNGYEMQIAEGRYLFPVNAKLVIE